MSIFFFPLVSTDVVKTLKTKCVSVCGALTYNFPTSTASRRCILYLKSLAELLPFFLELFFLVGLIKMCLTDTEQRTHQQSACNWNSAIMLLCTSRGVFWSGEDKFGSHKSDILRTSVSCRTLMSGRLKINSENLISRHPGLRFSIYWWISSLI